MNSSIKIRKFLQKGTLYCCVIVLVLLNSCNLNSVESLLQVEEELTVELAQKWVERGARIDETDEMKLWEHASKEKVSKKEEAVIVPIAQKTKKDYPSYKQLWVYRDQQKKEQMRYIEYIYDTQKPKNRLQTLKKFTGSMILRAYNGTFLGGLSTVFN